MADIYHVTGDINYFINFLPRMKTVLTVHDIGHYLFGLTGVRRWLYKWLWLIWPIRGAAAVTAVSVETRNNIRKYLGVDSKSIEIIENCHGAIFKPAFKAFSNECPMILQVGTKPYKNVPRLVEAIEGLRCRLVLVGNIDEETRKKLKQCRVNYENYVNLSRDEVYRRYVECDLVAFLSVRGEGFGVPIIEAQAVGRPVITSKLPPMTDVAGEGACLVNPVDVAEIRAGIQKIIFDATYRSDLIQRGFQNVRRYSTATICDRYLDLYRRLSVM